MSVVAEHLHELFKGWGAGMWALFALESAVTVWVLWLAVRWTLQPKEDAPDHVKRSILDGEDGTFHGAKPGDAS